MSETTARSRRTRHVLLVGNIASRRGRNGLLAAQTALKRDACVFETVPLTTGRDLSDLVQRRRNLIDAVAVAGGDGTLNSVAQVLIDTGIPLLILPTGSANDLARTLGIPPDLPSAARLLRHGQVRFIDVGLANDRPFFNVAHIGLGAAVTQILHPRLKRKLGPLAYPVAAFKALRFAKPFSARVESERGSVDVKTFQISVGNGRYYGGGSPIEAGARIDDGKLDLYSLEVSDLLRLLALAPRVRTGRQRLAAQVRVDACTRFEVRTRRPRAVSLDGEILTHTPVTFTVRPHAVAVFTPADPSRPTPSGARRDDLRAHLP